MDVITVKTLHSYHPVKVVLSNIKCSKEPLTLPPPFHIGQDSERNTLIYIEADKCPREMFIEWATAFHEAYRLGQPSEDLKKKLKSLEKEITMHLELARVEKKRDRIKKEITSLREERAREEKPKRTKIHDIV
eukprot:m.29035 g.29035  ORF g.29035 m.29035 type:complete len:133 (-) comp4620_c0_seq2:97-495(-)